MRIYKSRKSNLGVGLIEVLMTTGVIALLSIVIFQTYITKSNQQKINQDINNLTYITSNLNNFLRSQTNFATVTTANLIASQVIPNEMIVAGTIQNAFGGFITFTQTTLNNPNDSITTTTNQLPLDACLKFGTSDLAINTDRITINGTIVKNVNTLYDATTLTNVTNSCQNNTNNTIALAQIIKRGLDAPGIGGKLFVEPSSRSKENPYYIANFNTSPNSPATTCLGGTTWNGSFCSCPINTKWNGTTCQTYANVTNVGSCPIGQRWNADGTCTVLPNLSARTAPAVSAPYYTTWTSFFGATPPPITPAPTETYTGNRRMPNTFTSGSVQHTQTDNASCNGVPGGNFDGQNCIICAYGSWNGFRCVTP